MSRSLGWKLSIARGFRGRCPRCGSGQLFRGYIKPVAHCASCGEAWAEMRADDFPPYATLFIVGLLFVPFFIISERMDISVTVELAVGLAAALVLTILLLPRCKGAIMGLMWSFGLSGNETSS